MCAKSFENPLIPHKRLREMYVAMVEARVLGKHMRKGFAVKTEACWIGAAIGLREGDGDLIIVGAARPLVDYVLGVRLKTVLQSADKGKLTPQERVSFAMGAASRMKAEGKVVLTFAGVGELSAAEWKRALAEALRLELPMIFVVVPEKKMEPSVADLALKLGVPGIPVDASDAVAMHRVTQESIGRARAGGGAALIEGVQFPGAAEPIALLGKQLLAKGVVSQSWIDKVEPRFRRKLPA